MNVIMTLHAHIHNYIYLSRFEKRYHFTQIDNFELVCFKSTVDEIHVAFYFASLAASDAEICSL